MSDAFNAALSALGSISLKMDVTANNIANSETNNFKKDRADMEEAYPYGVKVSISQVDTPGDTLPPDEKGVSQESSNVNLPEELVHLIIAEHDFYANLATIKTRDEMEKQFIDIII